MPGKGSRGRGRKGKDKALSEAYINIANVAFSTFSAPSIINVVSSSDIKTVMRYMFVFELYIPIAVSS